MNGAIAGLEILNLHAHGGMAEVYRARGVGADGKVWHYALKKILPELTEDADLLAMFVEEARVTALLVHPNVVRVYDLVVSDARDYFIVMEFLDARELADAIAAARARGETLPVWFAVHCAREILRALHHGAVEARDKGGQALAIVHRDVSPQNVMIGFDGQVKLTDFGVAKVQGSALTTQAGTMKGKFGYMSPEQFEGKPVDPRSDLFNVGILLYEAIVGSVLFAGDSPQQVLRAMLDARVPPLPPHLGVSPALDALLRRALQRDRQHRPSSASAFEAELAAIARNEGLERNHGDVASVLRRLFPDHVSLTPTTVSAPPTATSFASVVSSAAMPTDASTEWPTSQPPWVSSSHTAAMSLATGFNDADAPTLMDAPFSDVTREETSSTSPPPAGSTTSPAARKPAVVVASGVKVVPLKPQK